LNQLLAGTLDLIIEKKPEKPKSAVKTKVATPLEKNTVKKRVPVEIDLPASPLQILKLENLKPGKYQPRKEIQPADLESLADSIRVQGIIQPIVVRKLDKQFYEIIAGERRWRAAKLAGLTEIPVIIKEVPDEAAMAIALIENIQRQDLNVLEEAIALERLAKEFGLTHIQVAEAVGKSRTGITNLLRLLTLNEDVKMLLDRGEIEAGHAKVLLTLKGTEQSNIARIVVAKNLSVRETESLINAQKNIPGQEITKRPVDPDIRRLQSSLADKLGAAVKILYNQKGRGKIIIKYTSLDELEGILEHIQ